MSTESPWILLIDDDPEFGKVLGHFLKKMDVRLERTSTVPDFASTIKKSQPTVCLIDLNIRGIQAGFSMLIGLRKKFGPTLPLIVVSASDDQASISHAIECGADDFIVKPIDPQVFNAKVGRFIKLVKNVAQENNYTSAPEGGLEAKIGFSVSVKSIDELGFRVIGSHFLCKGALTIFSGKVFESAFPLKREVLATVLSCELLAEGNYLLSYEFSELADTEKTSLRVFLASSR